MKSGAEKEKLPNFFIVGAARSGTTALYHYLNRHPDIYMSPIKEPHYFATEVDPRNFKGVFRRNTDPFFDLAAYLRRDEYGFVHVAYVKRWEDYVRLFRNAENEKAIGEASVSYLYSTRAAENIKNVFTGAKIIMILRNPVERAFSHYIMDRALGVAASSFIETLQRDISQKEKGWGVSGLHIELGMYYEQVKRYLERFSRENIKIFIYEEFRDDFQHLVKETYQFLGVDDTFVPEVSHKINRGWTPRFERLNSFLVNTRLKRVISTFMLKSVKDYFKSFYYSNDKRPVLTSAEREFLSKIYREEIMRLSELLNKDLSSWTCEKAEKSCP